MNKFEDVISELKVELDGLGNALKSASINIKKLKKMRDEAQLSLADRAWVDGAIVSLRKQWLEALKNLDRIKADLANLVD